MASLKDNGAVSRGFIGVQIQPVTKGIAEAIGLNEPKGALVAETVQDGPAEKAGLKRGDTIVAVEGQPIRWQVGVANRVARREGAHRNG